MFKVTKVELLWSENRMFQRKYKTLKPVTPPFWTSLADANGFLVKMAIEAGKLGYDKTAYRITWENGNTYEGRYDLHHLGERQENPNRQVDLGDAVRGYIKFLTGDHKPGHLNEEQYAELLKMYGCDEEKRQAARNFLTKYEL